MNFEELQAFAGRSPMLSLLFVGLTIALMANEIALLFRGYKVIKLVELADLINNQNALVIDVSSVADFEKGHIVGSRNILPSQFTADHKWLAKAKSSPVVVLCRTGMTSAGMAKNLKKWGFEQVYWLDGGIASCDWPLAKGRN